MLDGEELRKKRRHAEDGATLRPVGMSGIEINPQFAAALSLIDKGRSVFITGRAGTGKSTLLRHYLSLHSGGNSSKNVAVVAPTGVAALNVGGQTIHSFFGFKPDVTPDKVKKRRNKKDNETLRALDTLVIDEISMVRADLLDCVEKSLRLNTGRHSRPFGGLQLVLIGDLYQLPPVVGREEAGIFKTHYAGPYFFQAHSFQDLALEIVELEKVYRQSDAEFIRLLNAIRNASITADDIALLNQRFFPNFVAPSGDMYVHLTTTNARADQINMEELQKINSREYQVHGEISGDFGREYLPTAVSLHLKVGAQVMLLNNDPRGRWVNGSIGKVHRVVVEDGEVARVVVKMSDGRQEDVYPFTWEIFRYRVDDGKLLSETVGAFTQFPLRLSFAVTIHKSQGKTFERTIIDLERGIFSHGQLYVALSRCVSLEGLVLKTAIGKKHLRLDYNVPNFLTGLQYERAGRELSLEDRVALLKKAIKNGQKLEMTYLKARDEKSTRQIIPLRLGTMTFAGSEFLGLIAHCLERGEERSFNVKRILELREI